MAVDKALYGTTTPSPLDDEYDEGAEEVEVEVINPDAIVMETEDGGAIIDFTGEYSSGLVDHDANLAEHLDDTDLVMIANDVIEMLEADKRSRKDWEDAYIKGINLLGLKIEERSEPWQGACGVFHPILTESVVRFQAQAIMDTFPASGPVRTKIVGREDVEKTKQAQRVEEDLNYLLTERMPEYRSETERMLFNLPLSGSAFKKMWYDPRLKRPVSMFVPADEFVVAYGASDLRSCPRYTHILRSTKNDVRSLQVTGLYRDVDLEDPVPNITQIREKEDDTVGIHPAAEHDDRHTIYEMHVDYDMPEPFEDPDGIARPHVISVTKEGHVLSIRRNWYEDDPLKNKRLHFSHYCYMPGMGFYGTGLIHLLGGLAKSSTSILRQLVDAGTLSNLPAGFKARGLRTKGDNAPLSPGEMRDVDVFGDKIADSIYMVPFKEPSTVLYQLLGTLVEEGRRIGSIAELDIGNISGETPVGTTLALMERSLKVMSAVQARIHASQKQELKILAGIVRDYLPEHYEFDVGEEYSRTADYDDRVDIMPVSDPNATTMAQRVVQYQAALQLAGSAPHIYNLPLLHRQMLEVLQIKEPEKIIKMEDDYKPMDPVTENMAILQQEPVKAFEYQDHQAHIQVHMAAMQDPKLLQLVGQSPNANVIQAAMESHIIEHIAFEYRKQVEQRLGTPMPAMDEPLPRDVEHDLSPLVAQAAQKLLADNSQEAQEQKAQEIQEDPMYQLQKREIELKERKQQADEASKQAELALEKLKIELDAQLKEMDIRSDEKIAGVKAGVAIGQTKSAEKTRGAEIGQKLATEIAKAKEAKKNAGSGTSKETS